MTTYFVRSFEDCRGYQKARGVLHAVFQRSTALPEEETLLLTDPFRRTARSVEAKFSAAWGEPWNEKHFVSKLTLAAARQIEMQHRVGEAVDCGHISAAGAARINAGLEAVASFGGPTGGAFHEDSTEYFTRYP